MSAVATATAVSTLVRGCRSNRTAVAVATRALGDRAAPRRDDDGRGRAATTTTTTSTHGDENQHEHTTTTTKTTTTPLLSRYLHRLERPLEVVEDLRRRATDYLLDSLNAVDADRARRSVGEAVAAAVKEEARRSEALWDERREELRREAEEAALERAVTEMASAARETEEDDHPVLGPVVADLGYKRVYCASVRSLKTVPIWERQRAYRHDRAKLMARDKLRNRDIGLPGIVALYESRDGQLSILDGQHRVGMMSILHDTKEKRRAKADGDDDFDDGMGVLDPDRILVEVFSEGTEHRRPFMAKHLFTEINKAEPVKLIDMPLEDDDEDEEQKVVDGTKVSDSPPSQEDENDGEPDDRRLLDRRRAVIDGAAERTRLNNLDMFKPSQRCLPPHLNIDNLREALFESEAVTARVAATSDLDVDAAVDGLCEWIAARNEALGRRYASENDDDKVVRGKAFQKAVKKAVKHDFYLGLESSWLNEP